MTDLRIGVIGLDHWYNARPALDALTRLGAKVTVISHWDQAVLRETAERYGAAAASTFLDVVAEDTVDAVCVFGTTDSMASACVAALAAGKSVIANKPAGMDIAEVEAIAGAQEATGRAFFAFDSVRRWMPAYRAIHEVAAEGTLGELRHLALSIHAPEPQATPGAEGPGWFADARHTPGGAFIDHAIYHADLVRWLAGEEVGFVQASIARLGDPAHELEDYGQATVATANSLVATIEDTWTAVPGGFRETIELTGTLGTIRWDSADGPLRIRLAADVPSWREIPLSGSGGGFLRHVVACLRGEDLPLVNANDARQNLAICLAAYQSASSGLAAAPQ